MHNAPYFYMKTRFPLLLLYCSCANLFFYYVSILDYTNTLQYYAAAYLLLIVTLCQVQCVEVCYFRVIACVLSITTWAADNAEACSSNE
jgi:hypothetical protein